MAPACRTLPFGRLSEDQNGIAAGAMSVASAIRRSILSVQVRRLHTTTHEKWPLRPFKCGLARLFVEKIFAPRLKSSWLVRTLRRAVTNSIAGT